MIASFGTPSFKKELKSFLTNPATGDLKARHRNLPREIVRLPDGMTIELSAGGQNTLIRSIIAEFTPRFVRKPKILLLGDAANKELITDHAALAALGIVLPQRGKAPDVLIHDTDRDWLIVIEAVTSHGPIDQKRKNELTALFASARPGRVFVTAFKDHKAYSRYHVSLAWETDAWVAETPDHMLHRNGIRFLGPYPD